MNKEPVKYRRAQVMKNGAWEDITFEGVKKNDHFRLLEEQPGGRWDPGQVPSRPVAL